MKLHYLLTIPILASSLFANAEVTLDGTLGRGGALPGPDYLIGADLGQQHGGNLFHQSARFIYAAESKYGLLEWIKVDDKVTVTLENMTELNTGWFKPENVPYPYGEVIQVNNTSNGKPAIFVYSSGIVSPTSDKLGQALIFQSK
jgi:hypothetical protein